MILAASPLNNCHGHFNNRGKWCWPCDNWRRSSSYEKEFNYSEKEKDSVSCVESRPAKLRWGTISLYSCNTSSNPLQGLSSGWKLNTSWSCVDAKSWKHKLRIIDSKQVNWFQKVLFSAQRKYHRQTQSKESSYPHRKQLRFSRE